MDDLESIDRAVAALEAQRSVLGDDVTATALRPLLVRREELARARSGEQRKLVTVLFADVVDFTVLSQQLDPEDTRSVMNTYFAWWRARVEAQGGVVEKFIGDAVMAVFGLHQAHEDDPHASIRAALAMISSLADLNAGLARRSGITLSMRVGIDTGEVVVSTLDERGTGDFVVVGETVNRASRLQSAAPRDGILISADTYRHVRGAFAFALVRGLQLKGIAAPIDAYHVLRERPRGFELDDVRGIEGVETSTVGRETQLRLLQERLADVTEDGSWQVVTIFGDAGVGKTRLLLDFDRWLADMEATVWWFGGRASPATQNQPGALLCDALTTRFGITESDLPEQVRTKFVEGFAVGLGPERAAGKAHLVGRWLGLELGDAGNVSVEQLDPPLLRRAAMAALGEYFAGLGTSAPIVILLEDLHWADDLSLECLDNADVVLRDKPVLVVATARPALLDRRPLWGEGLAHHARLNLEPLSRRETRSLAGQLLRRIEDAPAELADVIVAAAEGNPFFVEEIVKYLIDSGAIVVDGERWTIPDERTAKVVLPATLRGVLQARIDALPPSERDLLQRASVIGRLFWDAALAHLAPVDDPVTLDRDLHRLRRREVVYERELSTFADTREFVFKHALLRDVAYDGMLRVRRESYHAMAATWLEQVSEQTNRTDEYASRIAGHLELAGSPLAAGWCLRAARQAASVHALAEATELFGRGLHLVDDADQLTRFDLLAGREEVFDWTGDREAQEADLGAMEVTAAQLDDPDRQVVTLLTRARWAFAHSDYDASAAFAGRAADRAASAGLGAREAEARLMWGKGLTWRASHDQARSVLNLALVGARANGQHKIVGETLRYLSMVAINEGDFDGALGLLGEAREVLAAHRDNDSLSTVLAQFATIYYSLGRLDDARLQLEATLPIFRDTGNRYRHCIALGNLGSIALRQGHLQVARQRATESLEIARQLDDREATISALLVLGDVCVRVHDLDGADVHLAEALGLAQQTHAPALLADACIQRAVLALERADAQRCRQLAADAATAIAASGAPAEGVSPAFIDGCALIDLDELELAEQVLADAAQQLVAQDDDNRLLEVAAARAVAACRAGRRSAATELVAPLFDQLTPERLTGLARPLIVLAWCWEVMHGERTDCTEQIAALAEAYVEVQLALIGDDALRETYRQAPAVQTILRLRPAS